MTGLAEGFPPVTLEQWRQAADPKGEGKTFTTELEEGISTSWLYTAADALASDPGGLPGEAPYVRGARAGQPWAIRQETGAHTRGAANAQILDDLTGGAGEVLLRLDPAGEHGIPVTTVDDLDEVLNGVYLDLAPVALEAGTFAPTGALLLSELWRRRELPVEEVGGSLRLDPIGTLALAGVDAFEIGEALRNAAETVTRVRAEFPRVQVLAVDTSPYVDAGAGASYELALALSTALAYLRAGEAVGIHAGELAAALEFTLVAGPDQFLEIAKLRAARRLWAGVLEHCGVPAHSRRSRTYVRSSRRMVSSLDPWVNLLRATTAAFAAAVGGADGVTVLPFDEAVGETVAEAGPLGRRIARNTQHVLLEEASLHRVADPAGGSWYVESLTDQLAGAAWSQLQAIEQGGGIVEALKAGTVADELAGAGQHRQDQIARRKRALTGVNTFPLLGDDGLHRDELAPIAGPASAGLTPRRDAADFEHLRARAATLKDPKILLACVGSLAAHVNAAQWAKNFFEAGGVPTIASGADPDISALVDEHRVKVAAVCAGKAGDPGPTVAALRDAGVERIYAVGADAEGAERIKDGVDMVTVLGDLLDRFEAAG